MGNRRKAAIQSLGSMRIRTLFLCTYIELFGFGEVSCLYVKAAFVGL